MVVSRDSNHFGAAAFWGKRISAAGMIGIVMCNASPSVAPWQGREGRIGTNPICVSLPSTEKGGWLLDMATTTVAKNRIFRAIHNGETSIPPGWAMTSRGIPTTRTGNADLLMPLGGYKGSGLGLWVEIFCAVLSGGAMSTAVGGTYILDRPMNTSQMFLAIDVSRFATPAELQSRMESLLTLVKSAATADGYDEVLVAGEPEERIEAERREHGIPLDEATRRRLTELTEELGIDPASYSNFLRNS
jgi:LDH2 family malate/lactate/ureidoglycolate dehydrogenase